MVGDDLYDLRFRRMALPRALRTCVMRGFVESELSLSTGRDNGEFQDLIMWGQLTEEARRAVSQVDFSAPFNGANSPETLRWLVRPFSFHRGFPKNFFCAAMPQSQIWPLAHRRRSKV